MSQWSLQFETPDLARWIWLAVAVIAAAELVRYVAAGRRPASVPARFVIALMLLAIAGAARAADLVRFSASRHATASAALGLLVTILLVRAYRETTRAVSRRRRLTLLATRLLALAIVLLLLVHPVLQFVKVSRERSALVILLDNSRSMTVCDVPKGGAPADPASAASRLETVRQALDRHHDALEALSADMDLHWFTFSTLLEPVAEPALKGEGEHTALAAAVARLRESLVQSGGKPAGVILISDGRDNFSTDDERNTAGEDWAAAGVPLFAVGVGSETAAGRNKALIARRMDCPGSVSILNRLPVRAEFTATGLAGTTINVELLFDDEVVELQQARPTENSELLRIDLGYTPTIGGLHRVSVRARAEGVSGREGEATLSQFVRVTDEKIQVLYIDRPRYERAAVARALEASGDLRVTKLDLNRPADGASSPLPRSTGEWQAYHVVLIGDVDRVAFSDAGLTAVRDMVREHGRGLALLGGIRTVGSGQYRGTPLATILPVDLSTVGELSAPVPFELTPAGRAHPICRMATDATAGLDIWKRLPPFDGAGRLAGLTPTAETLMRTSAGQPLLVVTETGKGRVAIAAFDSTWRWSFADPKGVDAQRRFWRQLVLWLANRRPEVWVASDKPRYDLARIRSNVERVTLRAGVSEPTTGKTPEGAVVIGTLTGPGGKPAEIKWIHTAESLESRPPITEAGEYHVQVSAKLGNQVLGQSETAFVVTAPDPEMGDPTADIENLRRIAARTQSAGGEYVPIDQFGKLLERLAAKPHAAEITQVRRSNLVDDRPWLWFAAFAGLLAVEWVIRRRSGLV